MYDRTNRNEENHTEMDTELPTFHFGTPLLIQLRDPSYINQDGERVVPVDHPIKMTMCMANDCYPVDHDTFDSDKSEDPHTYTICSECIENWWADYYIVRDTHRREVS